MAMAASRRAWAAGLTAAALVLAGGCAGGGEETAPPPAESPQRRTTTGSAPPSSAGTPAVEGTTPDPTAPASPNRAEGDIRHAWERFFDPGVPAAQKVGLVEDGEMNELMVRAFAQDDKAREVRATVTGIRFSSPTRAEVTYSLRRGADTIDPEVRGRAVEQDGTWKISFATMCDLTEHGDDVPQAGRC